MSPPPPPPRSGAPIELKLLSALHQSGALLVLAFTAGLIIGFAVAV